MAVTVIYVARHYARVSDFITKNKDAVVTEQAGQIKHTHLDHRT